MIKGLIFDNDGVLVDSEESQIAAWKEFFPRFGKHIADHELPRLTRGRPAREVIGLAFPDLSREKILALAAEREQIHIAMLKQGMKRVAGVRLFLTEAKRAGFRLAVGTSAHRAKLEFMLKTVSLFDFFDEFVTSDDVEKGKPAPDVFVTAARRLGLKNEECVVFEDAHNGVEAARRAGMHVVVLTTSHRAAEFESDNIVAFCRNFAARERRRISGILRKQSL